MPRRDDMGKLRSLLGEKGYAAEPLPGGRSMKLIRLDIGHAVKNRSGHIGFNLAEALRFLRDVKDDEA